VLANNEKSKFTPIADENLSLEYVSKRNADVFRKVKDAAENSPQIYAYFGVPAADYVLPLSSLQIGRIANERKSDSFDYSLVGIDIVDEQYFPNLFPQVDTEVLERLEISAILKIIFRAIVNMETFLGIESKNAKVLQKRLCRFYHILNSGSNAIYLQVKCPKKEIDMIIYRKKHRGN
jgi:hypothetical protein